VDWFLHANGAIEASRVPDMEATNCGGQIGTIARHHAMRVGGNLYHG
jgi:hypothetical protein